jgi:hypothetical protein
MMRIQCWTRIALLGFGITTASCAASHPPSVEPPRLMLPDAATRPCRLERLPPTPTQADLEIAYAERGARLVACDAARALAVETLLAERAMQDQWRGKAERRRRFTLWP